MLLDRRSVEEREVRLAAIEDKIFVEIEEDHELVEPDLEVLKVLVLIEELHVDLLADDLAPDVVPAPQDQVHLLEDVLGLLSLLHSPERLHLCVARRGTGRKVQSGRQKKQQRGNREERQRKRLRKDERGVRG